MATGEVLLQFCFAECLFCQVRRAKLASFDVITKLMNFSLVYFINPLLHIYLKKDLRKILILPIGRTVQQRVKNKKLQATAQADLVCGCLTGIPD